MNRWEYREVVWQPGETTVMTTTGGDEPTVEKIESADWPRYLGEYGAEGWELVSCTASPVGVHEYYFYFKRPLVS